MATEGSSLILVFSDDDANSKKWTLSKYAKENLTRTTVMNLASAITANVDIFKENYSVLASATIQKVVNTPINLKATD